MPPNRSLLRNVSFYDAAHPDIALGGLVQNGSITESNFLDILAILLVVEDSPILVEERASNHIVSRTELPLPTGVYDIYCDAPIQVTDEPWVEWLETHKISRRERRFQEEIRLRDRKCVISGIANPEGHIRANKWSSFHAAHIFPLKHESYWVQHDYGRWITDVEDTPVSSRINSCRNGFLLDASIHIKFDHYLVSVNPDDDNYKIVVFETDYRGLDGRILDPTCRHQDDPHRVSDELLRWHFRQSVLANMRGG